MDSEYQTPPIQTLIPILQIGFSLTDLLPMHCA